MLNPEQTRELIQKAGGSKKLAEMLGIDDHPRYLARIGQWKVRGMPPAVILEHLDTIKRIQRRK